MERRQKFRGKLPLALDPRGRGFDQGRELTRLLDVTDAVPALMRRPWGGHRVSLSRRATADRSIPFERIVLRPPQQRLVGHRENLRVALDVMLDPAPGGRDEDVAEAPFDR